MCWYWIDVYLYKKTSNGVPYVRNVTPGYVCYEDMILIFSFWKQLQLLRLDLVLDVGKLQEEWNAANQKSIYRIAVVEQGLGNESALRDTSKQLDAIDRRSFPCQPCQDLPPKDLPVYSQPNWANHNWVSCRDPVEPAC